MKEYETVQLLEPIQTEDGEEITEATVPMGPAASQIAIKQLGTNGGGFFGTNSAYPLENPTPFSNLIEMLSLLLIPVSLCFTFGKAVKDKRQGRAIFAAMAIMLVLALAGVAIAEQNATPQLMADGQVNIEATDGQSGGNMEGKESRFGIAASSTWAVFTTAASNGSVNSMHDSYTPLGGDPHASYDAWRSRIWRYRLRIIWHAWIRHHDRLYSRPYGGADAGISGQEDRAF